MKTNKTILGLLASILLAGPIFSADKVVYVHGRSDSHCGTGTTDVNNYWGDSKNISTGEQRYFVGYDGSTDPRNWGNCRAQSSLWTVLYNQCRGENSCKIVCHSAGCYATDYFLSKYGFVTDSYDVNVRYVLAAASASGGSELADLAFWESNSMVAALKTGTARSFNHNVSGGVASYHVAGFDGDWYSSWRLSGEDDGAVAFHTTCGKNTTGSYDDCKYDGTQWTNHYVWNDASEAGYSSGKQAIDTDHGGVRTSVRNMYNRLFGY